MLLQVAALQYLGAVLRERAGHRQLVEELLDQDAGFLAVLENHRHAVQRAEVLIDQEVGEAESAVGVSAGRVQGIQQRLQADVAYEVIVHVFCVGVEVILLRGVGLAAHHTQGCRAEIGVPDRVWQAHGRLGGWETDPAKQYFLRSQSGSFRAHPQPKREQHDIFVFTVHLRPLVTHMRQCGQ